MKSLGVLEKNRRCASALVRSRRARIQHVVPRLHALWHSRRAVTSLEYGIVATFLCLSLLAIFRQFSTVVTAMFTNASNGI